MMKSFGALVLLLLCFVLVLVDGKKMSRAAIKECYEKSKDLLTGCDFLKCFHERYRCNDESITAWALELCQQFPKDIILQFTAQGQQTMINIQNCTQTFLARTFRQRKSLNCDGFEGKYFEQMGKCYGSQPSFCQVFKENRAIFMQQATTTMLKRPRALQVFAVAAKNCSRMNH